MQDERVNIKLPSPPESPLSIPSSCQPQNYTFSYSLPVVQGTTVSKRVALEGQL